VLLSSLADYPVFERYVKGWVEEANKRIADLGIRKKLSVSFVKPADVSLKYGRYIRFSFFVGEEGKEPFAEIRIFRHVEWDRTSYQVKVFLLTSPIPVEVSPAVKEREVSVADAGERVAKTLAVICYYHFAQHPQRKGFYQMKVRNFWNRLLKDLEDVLSVKGFKNAKVEIVEVGEGKYIVNYELRVYVKNESGYLGCFVFPLEEARINYGVSAFRNEFELGGLLTFAGSISFLKPTPFGMRRFEIEGYFEPLAGKTDVVFDKKSLDNLWQNLKDKFDVVFGSAVNPKVAGQLWKEPEYDKFKLIFLSALITFLDGFCLHTRSWYKVAKEGRPLPHFKVNFDGNNFVLLREGDASLPHHDFYLGMSFSKKKKKIGTFRTEKITLYVAEITLRWGNRQYERKFEIVGDIMHYKEKLKSLLKEVAQFLRGVGK